MTEAITRIVISLIALVIGWAIGFFDSNMRAEKKIKAAEERAKFAEQKARAEAERAIAEAKSAQAAPVTMTMPGKNLLRLWLDEKESPRLDLDDQNVNTTPISDVHRKRLISLLNVLRPWIEGKPSATPAPASPPPAPAAVSPSPVFSPPSPAPVIAPAPATPLSAKKEEKPSAPLSMVAQIDEILQARLVSSPLADHAIKLMESPEGGVIVLVGLQKFNGVGEVTDPQIQAEIRAAIAEWEKKYTPGI